MNGEQKYDSIISINTIFVVVVFFSSSFFVVYNYRDLATNSNSEEKNAFASTTS